MMTATTAKAQIDIKGSVFGGARQADVEGSTFVNIGADHQSVVINAVYGGNDISGNIGTSTTVPEIITSDSEHGKPSDLQTYNAFVRTNVEGTGKHLFIGQLFGSGNGDYTYESTTDGETGLVTHIIKDKKTGVEITRTTGDFNYPSLDKTFIDIHGGTIGYVFGGGNLATVNVRTDIGVNNTSEVTTDDHLKSILEVDDAGISNRLAEMGLNTAHTLLGSTSYQIARVFGGNNQATMAIRPSWHLVQGKIRDLYSGGNAGNMTHPNGIALTIKRDIMKGSGMEINNVYGGCRMADVNPNGNEKVISEEVIDGIRYPALYAARVYINGGKIQNVYGGNDITGNVHGGNAVGIHCSILGNVYGGGNGSYPYTDNPALLKKDEYKDYYYDKGTSSVESLNAFRPNAERVSIRIGDDGSGVYNKDNPIIIGGAIYCGGNSATLYSENGTASAQLKIGSYVIADKVFLGNNGENMIRYNEASGQTSEGILRTYVKQVDDNGNFLKNGNEFVYGGSSGTKFNSMDLSDATTFGKYMDGCAMTLKPSVTFDNKRRGDPVDYDEHSTSFGSFYCGGNVGSMKFDGPVTIDFNHRVVIYEKLVGGCNDAYVPERSEKINNTTITFNAAYEGGVIGNTPAATPNDKLTLNLSGLKIEPKRWNSAHDGLEWNTVDASGQPVPPVTDLTPDAGKDYETSDNDDLARRLEGGNIYGGCYSSGVVDGNVIINLNATIMECDMLFDELEVNATDGEASLYDGDVLNQEKQFHITKRNTGVILGRQGMDVFGKALNVFGGGKGAGTEIWGSTTINLNEGYVFQIFGGSEEGVIGKPVSTGDYDFSYQLKDSEGNLIKDKDGNNITITKKYQYDPNYSCYVNLKGAAQYPGVSKSVSSADANYAKMAECEFMYGGGFLGPIAGNTVVNLGNGRIFNSFAGSCNADILGHTETYIGRSGVDAQGHDVAGYPWVRDYVYGGNDLGGIIMNSVSFASRVREETDGMRYSTDALTASAYTEYTQGRAIGIFGGCYGTYDYTDPKFDKYTYTATKTKNEQTGIVTLTYSEGANAGNLGTAKEGFIKPRLDNAFVNFRPISTNELRNNVNNKVDEIYGAGQGYPGDGDRDKMQKRSYVLIDIPQDMVNYQDMVVFGSGAWSGLGMEGNVAPGATGYVPDEHSAIVDLVRGNLRIAYGGSYQEGITRRTVVNVPAIPTGATRDTLSIGSIFGGAFGTDTYSPCDVYESNVNYRNGRAALIYDPASNESYRGAIYGGNNNERRTLYSHVNIESEVRQRKVIQYNKEIGTLVKGQKLMTVGTVYGAGQGKNTWSEYTEVNLNNGAVVYEVYGGGQKGKVFNAESIQNYIIKFKPEKWADDYQIIEKRGTDFTMADWKAAWTLGGGLDPTDWDASWTLTGTTSGYAPTSGKSYWENPRTNLSNPLVRVAEMDDRDYSLLSSEDKALVEDRYCTNVIINEGATVNNYAYAGGYGVDAVVSGTTYISLLGGEVKKDIYAAGTSGSVEDYFGVHYYDALNNPGGFTASANAYVQGGTVRNVYGGGWRGSVGHHGLTGHHTGQISDVSNNQYDIDGEVHVVIGNPDTSKNTYTNGVPSVTRNVYGGGEGGTVFGNAYVTINKGYIGFRYMNTAEEGQEPNYDYVPELIDDQGQSLDYGGNVFGGGYVANSYVDSTHVTMWGGIVRGSLYGGGEIGPIGRGTVNKDSLLQTHIEPYIKHDYQNSAHAQKAAIYKGGSAQVYLYGGHVMRDVFGGGRGYDNWGGDGWMTDEEKITMDRSSKGYVFGSTDVHIRGGEIGTGEGALHGYGNVFGGGNEGFVYSATGEKKGTIVSDDDLENGLPTGGGGYYYDTDNHLTVDCNVVVEPYCKVYGSSVTIGTTTYDEGSYVPVEALNKLKNKNDDAEKVIWDQIYKGDNKDGVIIHNAVFAGGNITEGSDKLFANTITVYGNAAASLRDVYNRDLITLGTDELGGLYGDGNLTLVDGFRELHIDNYGTDYYSLDDKVDYDIYQQMSDREKDYYQLKYVANKNHKYEYWESKSLHTYKGTAYRKGQKITQADYEVILADTEDQTGEKDKWVQGVRHYIGEGDNKDEIDDVEWSLMDPVERENWTLAGVFSIYAGRPMNTIQRSDFCGVFGSRMVLKGAQDRVPQVVDYTDYTINRVDEVSLNKSFSETGDNGEHGNYFGIYSSVNYLGNLTSDVRFEEDRDIRETSSMSAPTNETYNTYYKWKASRPQDKYRNNGISVNKVALASGVYLEIKREETETAGEDKWGRITGVVELDLINVMQGMGGGYVYAKNEHGEKTYHDNYGKVSLLTYNEEARTYRQFTYDQSKKKDIETSGNFVHNTKQIVDDCYPNSGMFRDEGYVSSPAHYWFIKGSIYVYDQYISAYTGAANAYAEKVELPLTIAAASNGRLTLREVQPNYYAYNDKMGKKLGTEGAEETLVIKNKTYHLNDPISYWDYRLLSDADKDHFEEETYTTIAECTINGTTYPEGYTMLPDEYSSLKASAPKKKLKDDDPEPVPYVYHTVQDKDVSFDFVFRRSNNLGHNTGYVLTFDMNNPGVWDNYYSLSSNADQTHKLDTKAYIASTAQGNYTKGPTYTPKPGQSSVYGQHEYKRGSIINNSVKTKYDENVLTSLPTEQKATQAQVEQAYIVTGEIIVRDANGNEVQILNPGVAIAKGGGYPTVDGTIVPYTDAQWQTITSSGNAELATVCTSLIEFSPTDYVWAGKVLSSADVDELKAKVREKYSGKWTEDQFTNYFNNVFENAWYCTQAGPYGGSYFVEGKAYRALETFCAMSKEDRDKFDFNYDGLDLLIDPSYSGRREENYGDKPQYDGYNVDGTKISDRALTNKIYSATQRVDYTAECTIQCSYTDENNTTIDYSPSTSPENWLTQDQYEDIPNEKHYYSPIVVTAPGNYYVANKVFMVGDIPYTAGQVIEESTYNSMTADQKDNVDKYYFSSDYTSTPTQEDGKDVYAPKTYYYCHQSYTVNEKGEGKAISTLAITKNDVTTIEQTYNINGVVPQGVIIRETTDQTTGKIGYDQLVNKQVGFIIHGTSPTEVSTLYVSSESDIYDLSKEKIITVIYLYEYEESDATGANVTPVSERHIVNIHINFKSGVPQIDELNEPSIVLPGTTVVLETPTFSQGAYRVTESGWELFTNQSDAETHTNGQTYYNNETPMYWYQNGYWVAYYAQTYLGKTYSNAVQFKVANYHDLKKVMDDKLHHYYIDHPDVDYEPKIYINDYTTSDPATSQNGLDLLKDLIDLSHIEKTYTAATTDEEGHIIPSQPIPISDQNSPLYGHIPLERTEPTQTRKPMRGGKYLEFFLRTDLDHGPTADPENEGQTIEHPWTPVANGDNECFSGVLHGDGHTISGLDNSLIKHLCGDVYNLGVTGSFTGAGIAEDGGGYVENCWINTKGTPDGSVYAVFGNPSDEEPTTKQIVNSYYQTGKNYKTTASEHGVATAIPDKSFYNGEVAYNLNGFYLYKRYSDQMVSSGTNYKYWKSDESEPQTGYYASNPNYCSSGYNGGKYVEDRFADGDFIYAGGSIPDSNDERLLTDGDGKPVLDENDKPIYYPKWPDDYLFFGQILDYGYSKNKHQDIPSSITALNRVYRAPAYFRSSEMRAAYFNAAAVFAKNKKGDEKVEAYKDMTAIDFTGSNSDWSGGFILGDQGQNGRFYPPLIDDGGLTSFSNEGLTRNLLVYTGTTAPASSATNAVVSDVLTDEAYEETAMAPVTTEMTDPYRYHTVEEAKDRHSGNIKGHWVERTEAGTTFEASRDHFLVDKEDFYAPIGYQFVAGAGESEAHRMWYQRMPDNYVGQQKDNNGNYLTNAGWEGISLPFKAEIVTTNQKGEITHFYSGSWASSNNDDAKIGHEYWLREFEGGSPSTEDNSVFVATFNRPAANSDDGPKDYTNTFLWDYYYSCNGYDDLNSDDYQESDPTHTYYKTSRTHTNYPRLANGTPYIIGFPGERYYEFDLSGQFKAETALSMPAQLGRQVITFASKKGAMIVASDLEKGKSVTEGNNTYTFQTNYLKRTFNAGTTQTYTLKADGSSYDLVPAASNAPEVTVDPVTVDAFRPYFTVEAANNNVNGVRTRSIIFSEDDAQLKGKDDRPKKEEIGGTLDIYAKRHKIIVESSLDHSTDVRIVNTAGITVSSFTIEPGETVETRIINIGVYIVQTTDGLYNKKLAVR